MPPDHRTGTCEQNMYTGKNLLVYLSVLLVIRPCFSIDSITQNQPLNDGDFLISEGEIFELGFFTPGNSSNRYIGVWYYNFPEKNIVWVVNRDSAIANTSGVLSVDERGQLVLYYSENPQVLIWSSNISGSGDGNYSAKLLDTGNFVVFKNEFNAKTFVWQGFDHPTDTYLPQMKLGLNKRTGENKFITSWKSPDNPGTGQYAYKFDLNGPVPQLFIFNGLAPLMRMGPWNGITYSGVPDYAVSSVNVVSTLFYIDNEEEVSTYYIINNTEVITRFVLTDRGTAQRLNWNRGSRNWDAFWTGPSDLCDTYKYCGAFSNCNPFKVADQGCECLPGYKDNSDMDSPTNKFGGCARNSETIMCKNGEGFKNVSRVKVPDTSNAHLEPNLGINACKDYCLANCSCTAYTTANISNQMGCLTWYRELVDVREFSDGGQELYIRVDRNELDNDPKAKDSKKEGKRIFRIVLPVVIAILLILVLGYWFLRRMMREKEDRYPDVLSTNGRGTTSTEVHCFSLRTITAATDNFSFSKKLGEGGFGPVYKGQLHGGQDIAVKRLSVTSNQGLEEFRNEIILIAKLQHKNLVRLLGYCIQQEKMLIYEYLPNRGLDGFIFARKSVLDWGTRFGIVMGIARGMIYLHHDSRLKIIHRDLKASNILLDASMNPKISDFGMARIFGSDRNQETTKRVVGTYGYMSPEYAMEGHFSIKSDVFSFGVLLLEIISGRKNTSTFDAENSINLIGHVWDLWLEGKPLEIVDPLLGDSYVVSEVFRCIHVGLLCVQESAAVRPTMSEVASMLCNEKTPPSVPDQPAFINRARAYSGPVKSSSSSGFGTTTAAEMTASIVEGR